jgi:LPS-assembly protein
LSRFRPALFGAALLLVLGFPLWAQEEVEPEEQALEELSEAQSREAVEAQDEEGDDESSESAGERDRESNQEEPEPDPVDLELPGLPSAEQRITFELPFAVDSGGGSARGSARALEYLREDYVIARGGVELTHADMKFQGDRVEVDLVTKIVTARGNVILDQGPRRVTGETLVYDIESETGQFTEATAYVDPDIYFTGSEIEKIGEELYVLKDGVVTSCSSDTPVWSFKAGTARVNTQGYTKVKHSRMRIKKLPILYAPYMLYPSNQERKSGFLFPNVGYSDRRGYQLGMAYYQTLGPSYDATFFADIYGEDFLGVGTEFRYRPTFGTFGNLEAYLIDDPEADTTRWKASLRHETNDLPFGMRGVVRATQFSDFDFFRDFERDFSQISLRRISSAAYVTGNWSSHSFNIVLDELETFIRGDVTQTQRQLPEIEYLMRPTKLGPLPVYLDLASSAHYFQAGRSDLDEVEYGRADLSPQLSVPLSYWPWLSVKVTAGGRVTYYEDSLTEDRSGLSGESLTRVFPFGDVSIIGPSFSRIFEKKIGVFGKFKHIIEPRLTYDFVGDPDDQELVPIFDQIDNVREQSIITYALVNRLLAKPADEESGLGAREIMSFELSQSYSLNEDQPFQISSDGSMESRHSRLGMRFRFTPALRTNFEARATYSGLFNIIDTASVSGGTNFGNHSVGLTWFARLNAEQDRTTSHQGRIFTSFAIVPSRLRYSLQANYDFVLRELQSQRHIIQFFAQCYGLLFELREVQTTTVKDTEYRVAISLKNIGTFLDLNGGSSEENF